MTRIRNIKITFIEFGRNFQREILHTVIGLSMASTPSSSECKETCEIQKKNQS